MTVEEAGRHHRHQKGQGYHPQWCHVHTMDTWPDAIQRSLHLHGTFSKNSPETQCKKEENNREAKWKDILQNALPALLKTVKVRKNNEERLRNCHRPHETKEACQCCGLTVSPPKLRCWNFMANVIVSKSEAFKGWLGHEGFSLAIELRPRYRGFVQHLADLLFCHVATGGHSVPPLWSIQLQSAALEAKSSPHWTTEPAGAAILDFPTSRTVRDTFLLFISCRDLGILLQQHKQTKIKQCGILDQKEDISRKTSEIQMKSSVWIIGTHQPSSLSCNKSTMVTLDGSIRGSWVKDTRECS